MQMINVKVWNSSNGATKRGGASSNEHNQLAPPGMKADRALCVTPWTAGLNKTFEKCGKSLLIRTFVRVEVSRQLDCDVLRYACGNQ